MSRAGEAATVSTFVYNQHTEYRNKYSVYIIYNHTIEAISSWEDAFEPRS